MAFKYVCFISYPHPKSSQMKEFVDELKEALKNAFDPYFDQELYIDTRLAGGDHFNQELAQALCRSFCMIVIYVPRYEKHPFCLQEFRAMEILEKKRMELAGTPFAPHRGMIIPIVFRGEKEELPEDIKNQLHYLDFSEYTTATPNIRGNLKYVQEIEKVARKIYELHRLFENIDPCRACDEFILPDVTQIQPLSPSGKLTPPPFPGSQTST
jgi:hypothetical protein